MEYDKDQEIEELQVENSYNEEQPQEILIDVIGLGSGVVDRLAEQNLPVRGVNVAEAPSTKKNYLNLRAELWFAIKDWLVLRNCRLPNDDELVSELAAPSYKYTSTGKIKIESKDEMKKRGVKSPDKAADRDWET